MSTITATVTTTVSAIPLLRHRDTVVVFPTDQDDFVAKYEATNDHLSGTTVAELNAIGNEIDIVTGQINVVAGEVNTNASTATTKAAEAVAARDIAVSAQIAAEAALDSFDDRYLGSKATAPTLDNDGNALVQGATYWNTVNSTMYVYDGTLSQWIANTFVPTSHTSLSGLTSDDHTQYHNDTRGDARYYTKTANDTLLNAKQATLVSGTNIKTIGGASILGSGDIDTSNLIGTASGVESVSISGLTLGENEVINFILSSISGSFTAQYITFTGATSNSYMSNFITNNTGSLTGGGSGSGAANIPLLTSSATGSEYHGSVSIQNGILMFEVNGTNNDTRCYSLIGKATGASISGITFNSPNSTSSKIVLYKGVMS